MQADKWRVVAGAVVVLAMILVAPVPGQAEETAPAPVRVRIDSVASTDGLMIHYEVHGSGKRALVFVHCWSCDRNYWDSQVKEFEKYYPVIMIDLAGHGESGLGRRVWSMAAYGADVATVVKRLRLTDVILVGHSMGGAVCLEAARLLPGSVTAIVGVDTYQDLTRTMDPQQAEQMLAPFRADFAATTENFVRSLFPAEADTTLVNRVAKDMASEPVEVGLGSFEQLFSYNSSEALKEVRVPVRTINADRFPTNVEGNKALAASFEVKYMPGHGHFLHMEDPAGFNALLHETLAEFWPAE